MSPTFRSLSNHPCQSLNWSLRGVGSLLHQWGLHDLLREAAGCLIYPAPNHASVVDHAKEDIDDDKDGVVDSYLVHPKPIFMTADKQMLVITLHLQALKGNSPFRNLVVDERSDLTLVELNGALTDI